MFYLRCFSSKYEKFFTRFPFHPFVLSAESHNRGLSSKLRLPFLSKKYVFPQSTGLPLNTFFSNLIFPRNCVFFMNNITRLDGVPDRSVRLNSGRSGSQSWGVRIHFSEKSFCTFLYCISVICSFIFLY